MSDKFKLNTEDYKKSINTYNTTVNQINTCVNVSRMSTCAQIIVNDYVDRIELIGKLITKYIELVNKDVEEFSKIADEIAAQEIEWANAISNK